MREREEQEQLSRFRVVPSLGSSTSSLSCWTTGTQGKAELSWENKTILSFPGCLQIKNCLVLKVKDKVALPQLSIRF